MSKVPKPASRYELRELIGEGGMGRVYKALDRVLNREVTIKTIRDTQDKAVLELFRRECTILGQMAHPNIVEVFDVGEMEVEGARRPYFVMPLLKGVTLNRLIETASSRLSIDRAIQMIAQLARGLQAAHDLGLVHRDLKPSNVFVLDDDSIKLIDFGVAHLVDTHSATGLKGTLLYMAPEQIRLQKPTAVSDQFSLAMIAYEMFTLRHPFYVPGMEDVGAAIANIDPPPANEINPAVTPLMSQVIHKALAKQPLHRFASVREFAEYLQKAVRNEIIELFDPSRVEPRIQRAQRALAAGDLDFAGEIIRELKAESYLNPEINRLDSEISVAIKNRDIQQLLETARRRFEENEQILALQKVQEVLNLDSTNLEAITLQAAIEGKRSSSQADEWLKLARQHLSNHAYSHAREALAKLLDQRPNDLRGKALAAEVARLEMDAARLRSERQKAFELAKEAYRRGDVNSAISNLERCLDADRKSQGVTDPGQSADYQRFYDEVRSKQDHLRALEAEVRQHIAEKRFAEGATVCDKALAEFAGNVVFRVLRDDAEEGLRQEVSAFVAHVERSVADEPDLNRKVAILESAQARYPQESRFEQSLRQARSRRDLVGAIVARAQTAEAAGNFVEALSQWETLRNIYPQFPGLKVEVERLNKRREDQSRQVSKANWVSQIDQAVNVQNFDRACSLVADALAEFPADTDLLNLESTVTQLARRELEAEELLSRANKADAVGSQDAAIDLLRSALGIAPHHQTIRQQLIDALLKRASGLLESNWQAAEPLVAEASSIEPKNPLARSLQTLIADKRQTEAVSEILGQARLLQAQGQVLEAIRVIDAALQQFSREARLIQLRSTLAVSLQPSERDELRSQDLNELRKLAESARTDRNQANLDTIFQRTRIYKEKYRDDEEISQTIASIEREKTAAGENEVRGEKNGKHVNPSPVGRTGLGRRLKGWPIRVQFPAWLTPRRTPLGLIAASLALVLVVAMTIWLRPGAKPDLVEVEPQASVPVFIKNAEIGYRIADSGGHDVTDTASARGLTPGSYRIRTSKPGYEDVDMEFSILTGAKRHDVEIQWKARPVGLYIHPWSGATVELDGQLRAPQSDGSWNADLAVGSHHLKWTSGTFVVEVDSDVTPDGGMTFSNWSPPNSPMLTCLAKGGAVRWEGRGIGAFRVAGELVAASGERPIQTGEVLTIDTPANGALRVEANNGATHSTSAYLVFVRQSRSVGPVRPQQVPQPNTAEPPKPAPPPPAETTQAESPKPIESPQERATRLRKEKLDRQSSQGLEQK